ncbi:hypothetical protein ACYJ80_06790 [Staphylococcus capitis]|jgi:hypothetical protein|uniref:hypothetical protein n=1 Tax=Staphylococcus TaxID=1279 RepID=UPI0003BEFACB|nr:hypothetical protein [Staphylococcus capitis]MBF2243343.1 hypothetical protein [Staphylococcus capitis]MBF2248169.1 hypothetical protein [Staphylococcus capitis]MBF8132170.1 hypothetical protein [Staphylococcus capitis]MBN6859319.1 hypothetical protein [Staphylococcus capitis]MCC3707537.1 hypothetical protein [Staphylococcus capitis]
MIKRDEKGNIVDNPRIKDKTGQRFGRLVVKEIDLNKASRKTFWICECDCGNVVSIRSDTLGSTKSCGCLKKEQDFKNLQLKDKQLHGLTNHPAYTRWNAMMQRCYRANSERYPRYGGRGIKVCDEWHDVKTFIKWAEENGFSEELSIERIDLNGDYEPSNCKWIPLEEQRWNTSYNVWYEYKGLRLTTMQWTRKLNIPIKETSSYRKNDIPFTDIIKKYWKDNPEITD